LRTAGNFRSLIKMSSIEKKMIGGTPYVTSIFSAQDKPHSKKPVSDSSKAPKKGCKNETTTNSKTKPKKCLQNKFLR
jgi:hypothetical protein